MKNLNEKIKQFNKKLKRVGRNTSMIHRLDSFDFNAHYSNNSVKRILIGIRRGEFDPNETYFYFDCYNDPISIKIEDIDDYIKSFDDPIGWE